MELKILVQDKPNKLKKRKHDMILSQLIKNMVSSIESANFQKFSEAKGAYDSYIKTLKGSKPNSRDRDILHMSNVKNIIPKAKGINELGLKKPLYYSNMLKTLYKVKDVQVPTNQFLGKWIGVEIECYIPAQVDDYYDEDDELVSTEKENYDDFIRRVKSDIEAKRIKYVSVKDDGSIRCEDEGSQFSVEFTILTKIDDMTNLHRLCRYLRELGAKVNNSCGLHIHLDQRDIIEDTDALSKKVQRFNRGMELMKKLVSPSRRNNTQYCSTEKSTLRNSSRYMAINTQSLSKFKTIEVRLHGGTTDYNKISNWIKFCYTLSHLTQMKNSDKYNIDSLETFKKFIDEMPDQKQNFVDVNCFQFLVERFNKLNSTTNARELSDIESNDYTLENNALPNNN